MSFKKGFFKLLVKIFRVTLVNPEKEPDYGVLLCSNHISNLDPVMIVSALKKPISFMAKKELFRIPVVGFVIKLFGAFPVERGTADLGAMKKAISHLENGNTVGIFPQGKRYRGIDIHWTTVKSGAGMIVARSNVDILPVAIISKNNRCGLFNKKYVILGDVIKFESLNNTEKSREEFVRISRLIFDNICDLYDKYSYLVNENNEKMD